MKSPQKWSRKRENKRERETDNNRENENTKVSVQEAGHLTVRNSRKVQRKWRDNYQRNNGRKCPRTEKCWSAD
jgi:hypothetical protein